MTTDTLPAKKTYSQLFKKILYGAAFLAAGFLLCRIELKPGLAPFGPAFITACFLSRRQETLLAAAGVILGALLLTQPLFVLMVSLLICALMLTVNKSSKAKWLALTIAAASYLISTAIFKTDSFSRFMVSILDGLLCLVMIYVLKSLITLVCSKKKRTVLTAEERISIVLGLFVFTAAFGMLNISGVYIANTLALLLVLCAAYCTGAAYGAGVGLCLGIACCLAAGAEVMAVGMLGVCGLAAGTMRRLKKPGAAISFFIAGALYIVTFYDRIIWPFVMIETAAAAVLFMTVPGKIFSFISGRIDTKAGRASEYKMHTQRFNELAKLRLSEVSEVFKETGEMFAENSGNNLKQDKNISGILSMVASGTCKSCVFRKSCWENEFINTYNVFYKLYKAFEKNNTVERSDLPPEFAKKCYNTSGILSSAKSVFEAYRLNLKWKQKICESREITGKQLKGVAQVVESLGERIDTGFKFLSTVETRVAAMVEQTGAKVREVCAEEKKGGCVSIGVRLRGASKIGMGVLEAAVSDACGVTMRKTDAQPQGVLRFEQCRKFSACTASASAYKGKVSGDSCLYRHISESRYLIMLCDGMGSGEAAKRQSKSAISLAEKLYRAGFEDSVVFETVNKLMLLNANDDVFSTMDLCMIDLNTGTAKFTKVGAESSFIIGRGGIQTIKPGALPVGILEEISPAFSKKILIGGDIIIMVSDGVTDAVDAPLKEWLMGIKIGTEQQIADEIIKKACGEEKPADDMTVIVSKIVEVQPGH